MASACSVQYKSLDTWTPSSLNNGTLLTIVPHSEMGGCGSFAIGSTSISCFTAIDWRSSSARSTVARVHRSTRSCHFCLILQWTLNIVVSSTNRTMITTRTDLPSSTALCQWCMMSTRACVVERPFNAPYWCLSSLSSILSIIHEPTKDSNSLLNVTVSEIGRISASISWGG